MVARDQHAAIQADLAERVGGLIWPSIETGTETAGRADAQAGDD